MQNLYERANGTVIPFSGVNVKIARVKIRELSLDLENPRNNFGHEYEDVPRNEKDIADFMRPEAEAMADKLEKSLRTKDDVDILGLTDWYVAANGVSKEGNQRLLACRILFEERGNPLFEEVAVMIFPPTKKAAQVLEKLVRKRHLTEVKTWPSVVKAIEFREAYAKCLDDRHGNRKAAMEDVSNIMGKSRSMVEGYIKGLRVWDEYVRMTGSTTKSKWSQIFDVADKFMKDREQLLPLIARNVFKTQAELRAWPKLKAAGKPVVDCLKRDGFEAAYRLMMDASGDDDEVVDKIHKASAVIGKLNAGNFRKLYELVDKNDKATIKARRAFEDLKAIVTLSSNKLAEYSELKTLEKRRARR